MTTLIHSIHVFFSFLSISANEYTPHSINKYNQLYTQNILDPVMKINKTIFYVYRDWLGNQNALIAQIEKLENFRVLQKSFT